jgi:uncharacterized membrane protein
MTDNTTPKTALPEAKEIHDGRFLASVAYWMILCILPLLLMKHNKFAVYHGKQGLVLFIIFIVAFILGTIPFLGWIIFRIVCLAYILFALWGTFQALSGKYSRIPFVSRIADKIIL